ncbi:carbonic anhydrase family protein [Leuconostocaceae bacterium ESL0958]|nr:carbonic anhydrase family protein [Leuconostocaceae bacterium ESL0958]
MQKLNYDHQSAWTYTSNYEQQSPIAFSQKDQQLGDLWQLDTAALTLGHLRNQVAVIGRQFYCEDQASLVLNGRSWSLLRFHIHDGAEHVLDGHRAAAELHFVCQNEAGATMVLALFAEASPTAPDQFAGLLAPEPKLAADWLQQALHQQTKVVTYTGTLTTPPILGPVTWLLFPKTIALSPADLALFKADYPDNHRACQPLAGRSIIQHPLQLT